MRWFITGNSKTVTAAIGRRFTGRTTRERYHCQHHWPEKTNGFVPTLTALPSTPALPFGIGYALCLCARSALCCSGGEAHGAVGFKQQRHGGRS